MTSLDSPLACMEELSDVNKEIGEFAHDWGEDAGLLAYAEWEWDRLVSDAIVRVEGPNAEARRSLAEIEAKTERPKLSESIAKLRRKVEEYKVRFRACERRASNAQSILAAMKEENKFSQYEGASG